MAATDKGVRKMWDRLDIIRTQLEEWLENKQQTLNNEENKDNPNDERVEKLEEQNDILTDALQSLQECCDRLEEYSTEE